MAPQSALEPLVERRGPIDVVGGCDLFDELGLLRVVLLNVEVLHLALAEMLLHRLLVELPDQAELQLRKGVEVVGQQGEVVVPVGLTSTGGASAGKHRSGLLFTEKTVFGVCRAQAPCTGFALPKWTPKHAANNFEISVLVIKLAAKKTLTDRHPSRKKTRTIENSSKGLCLVQVLLSSYG